MSVLGFELDRYVGLGAIVAENARTWSMQVGKAGRRDRIRAFVWFYMVPGVAFVFFFWHWNLRNIGQVLSGVAVFTALLFGLLVLMFNTGLALRKDGTALANAHDLKGLIGDLRANVTYAVIVGIALAVVLVLAAGTGTTDGKAGWGFTPLVAYLGIHLCLLLLTILRRFRTAFNYITR